MAATTANTFDITNESQFTEFGFSRIPRGKHHFHMQLTNIDAGINQTTEREYSAIGTMDLNRIGPQIIEKCRVNMSNEYLDDLNISTSLDDNQRQNTANGRWDLVFSTSLPTELSALDKTVTPGDFDYTSAQYRLEGWVGTNSIVLWRDGNNTGTGGGAAAFSMANLWDPSAIQWINSGWHDLETRPLVISNTIVVLFAVNMSISGAGSPIAWNISQESGFKLEIELITSDFSISNEDLWFSRKFFNQSATNRVMYYRFAPNPS